MAEMLEILDENGAKTGCTDTREAIHRAGEWHRTISVAVLDSQGRVLLQQRSSDKATNPNRWDITVAGHVDAGENSLMAARRELFEETGIMADGLEYVLSYKNSSRHPAPDGELLNNEIQDCYVLRVPEIDLNTLKLQKSEVQAAKLCTFGEFEAMIKTRAVVDRQPFYEKIVKEMKKEIKRA